MRHQQPGEHQERDQGQPRADPRRDGALGDERLAESDDLLVEHKRGDPEHQAIGPPGAPAAQERQRDRQDGQDRSEEHTSELQSLMRISYAVFCLKKKKQKTTYNSTNTHTKKTKYSSK